MAAIINIVYTQTATAQFIDQSYKHVNSTTTDGYCDLTGCGLTDYCWNCGRRWVKKLDVVCHNAQEFKRKSVKLTIEEIRKAIADLKNARYVPKLLVRTTFEERCYTPKIFRAPKRIRKGTTRNRCIGIRNFRKLGD